MRYAEGLEARHFDEQVVVTCGGVEHLSLTTDEFDLLMSLDGRRTPQDVCAVHGSDVAELLEEFRTAGLLEGTSGPREHAVALTENGIELGGFNRLIRMMHRVGGRFLLGWTSVAVASLTIMVGLLSLAIRGHGLFDGDSAEFSPAATLLILTMLGLGLAIVHESAHAIVTHHFGRRVGRAGFGMYWGALTFFVDSTDALLLPKRERILQAVSGPFVDAVIAAVLTLYASWIAAPGPWRTLLIQLAVLTWLEVLMNLVPLLELDGYWALSDALNRPHLRSDSMAALRSLTSGDITLSALRLGAYGLASIVFGLGALALSAWAWIYIYVPLVGSALEQGWIGALAAAVFIGPVVAGLVVAAPAAISAVAGRISAAAFELKSINQDSKGGEST